MKNKTLFFYSSKQNQKRIIANIKIGLLISSISILLTACYSQESLHTLVSPTPQPSSSLTIPLTITSTPEPTLTPNTTPLIGGALNEEGPWLMYQRGNGNIHFVNPDGTGNYEINSDIGSIANSYLFT